MEHMRSYVTVPSPPESDAYGVPASYQPLREASLLKPIQDNPQQRKDPFQFGTRYLTTEDDIFSHNAWDHVTVDPQYDDFIASQISMQRSNPADKDRYNARPEKWWDEFYARNNAAFFKDRKWLIQEFPLLEQVTAEDYGPCVVLEVGAGAGNTAFPLFAQNKNKDLCLHACDYSAKAIEVIRSAKEYQDQSILMADVWDLASRDSLPPGLEPEGVDVVILIFVFSALAPDQWGQAVRNVCRLLKPGGEVLFRDYGRGDLAQVRFKKGRYLEENFYVRGDGTRVYFFEEEELRGIWGKELEIVRLATDRRMLVNRQRRLKMFRCWMQGRFRKGTEELRGDGDEDLEEDAS
ncbi:methyltransferase [Piedraia hortae CBS 480.64]|uniref:tRNA N(3)-methylcytidine methyltransferase n=1 Tax=Piedraia hortae CBS 480.64 TaxID=1314780 RepID=A0A6A7C7P2_9PEZI|nr:methyltransferase [Piedraia hortae CBS 480.64]